MRKYTIIAWLACVFWLGTTFGASGFENGASLDPVPGSIVISDDNGGGINEHLKFYGRIRQSGVPVRVDGACNSACTLVMTLPRTQACVTVRTSFGFHSWATGPEEGRQPDPNLTEAALRSYYPLAYREWIGKKLRSHRTKLTVDRFIIMSANEIVKAGIFPACGD